MSDACQYLHQEISKRPQFTARFDPSHLPKNGLYFLFEKGEMGHGHNRIARVGTHTGQNNLAKRIREHLFTPNKDRSIFRKHIGRCLLSRAKDPFLNQWEIDLTTKKSREKYGHMVDKELLEKAERNVSDYMTDSFSFAVIQQDNEEERLRMEKKMLGTISQCSQCSASANWLGRHHPNSVIRESGLWNVQGLNSTPMERDEIMALIKAEIK